jgi:tRNA modification GTPase
VGKSSLLNVLLKEERAIVSDIPGTTRDTIEEVLHVGGLLFRFIDTAGLREGGDEIEELGMERTRSKLRAAEIVLAVAEATDTARTISDMVSVITGLTGDNGSRIIVVINKSDLVSERRVRDLSKDLMDLCSCPVLIVSARDSSGIETGRLSNPQYIVTNARHYEALKNVSESLQRVLDGFRDGIPTVLIATDVRQAIYFLGQITGRITPDDILGEIFSNFCIGK